MEQPPRPVGRPRKFPEDDRCQIVFVSSKTTKKKAEKAVSRLSAKGQKTSVSELIRILVDRGIDEAELIFLESRS